MTKRTWAVTVTALTLGALIGGCSTGSPGPQPTLATSTTPTTAASSPSSAPSPSTQPAEEKQIAAAEATVRRFWSIQDQLRQNAALPITQQLLKVTRDAAYDNWAQQLQSIRAREYHQIGNSVLPSVNGQTVARSVRPTVTVTVCYDVSNVRVVDKTGRSVVSKDRVNVAKAQYTVESFKDGWFITDDITRSEPCDG